MEPPQPQYGRIVDTGDRAELRLLVRLLIYTVSIQYLHTIYSLSTHIYTVSTHIYTLGE